MNKSFDCNKLAYADKIINENLRKYFEQKLIQAYKENDELTINIFNQL